MRSLDVGCGSKQRPGFVGLDRFPMPGVSVVADLDGPGLPFADSSFDLVVAHHSLEHFGDLLAVMREIWRVGRPGAQVCVVAPYYTSGLNLANPYHKQVFNEHTPRFWTDAPTTTGVDAAEWRQPPFSDRWGLASSDHSAPGFDLRLLRMEFFYFESYWDLPPARQRHARRTRLDVCEQIAYHLLVVKPPMTEEDAARARPDLYTPFELEDRRAQAARHRRGLLSRLFG